MKIKILLFFTVLFGITAFSQNQKSVQPTFDKEEVIRKAKLRGMPDNEIPGYLQTLYLEYQQTQTNQTPFYNPFVPLNYMGDKLVGNNGNQIQSAACVNASFETGSFINWGGSVGNSNTCGGVGSNSPVYTIQSPGIQSVGLNTGMQNTNAYHTIMNIPPTNPNGPGNAYFTGGYDSIAVNTSSVSEIPFVCPYFSDPYSVRMNGPLANYRACRMTYTFNITPASKNIQYAFALVMYDGGHATNEQPYFTVRVLDQNMNPIGGNCGTYNVNSTMASTDTSFGTSTYGSWYKYRKWRRYAIDLSAPSSATVTTVYLEFTVGGCCYGGHYAYAYVDAECAAGGATSSMCVGTNTAILTAPIGYNVYQWYAPGGGAVPAGQGGNTPTITINPAIAGQVYQVQMVTPTGCTVALYDTIKVSNVQITSIGSNPSCISGSSGSTWVNVTGSNLGYNYTWLNSSGAIVSTTNTATGLPPGIYTVSITAVSCGATTGTVQVATKPPTFSTQNIYYCQGNLFALITAPAGNSYHWWWGNMLPITPSTGSQTLNVTPPSNGLIVYMSYTTPQGCRDSIKYTLNSTTPQGSIFMSSLASICPTSGNVGYATVNLQTPLTGPYSYSVTGPGGYSNIITSSPSKKDSLTSLGLGTYTATVFDGACFYNTTFTISPYNFSYTVTPTNTTLCYTGTVPLSVNFGTTVPSSCGPATGGCTSPNIITLGTGNVVNTQYTYPSIYGNWYKNERHQLLFTAAELLAAGVQPGRLSSIAFMINSIPSGYIGTLPGFTIKLKCVSPSINALTTTFDNTGFTTVWGPANYTPVNGWNTHNFTTNYDWDGVSNVLVDICYTFVGYTTNPIMPSTNTGVVRCIYYYSDSSPACGTASAFGTSTSRPNTRFGNCGGTNPSQFTYTWSPSTFLSSTNTQSTQSMPSVSSSTTLIYTVTVNPIGQTNCAQSQTTSINVIVPTTPTITAPIRLCDNAAAVQLSVTPTTGTWSSATYLNTNGIFTPSVATIGSNTVSYSVGSGTCSSSSSVTINVEKYHPATLTGTIMPMCLPHSNINLQTLVADTNGVWNGSGGISGWSFNPSAAGPTTHTLVYHTHSVPTASLCPDSSSLVVSIDSLPTPSIVPVGPFCNTFAPLQMTVSPIGGAYGTTNALNANGMFFPPNATIGNNLVSYTITSSNGVCAKTATANISIEQFVSASLTGTVGPYCFTALPTNLNGITQNPGGTWTGTGVTGIMFDPALSGPGVFTLQYATHSIPTVTLCPDASTINVLVNPKPIVQITAAPLKECQPASFNLAVPTVSNGVVTWLVQGLPPHQGITYAPTINQPGTYSVAVSYMDNIGCTVYSVMPNQLVVYPRPTADFNASPGFEVTVADGYVFFQNMSSPISGNTYTWNVSNMFSSTDVNTQTTYTAAGSYIVSLSATNIYGCKDSITKTVVVKNEYGFYVPDAFTPFNGDGLNDEFKPVYSPYGLDTQGGYEMLIYDRWGHLIFKSNELDKGWDGTKAGQKCPQDVYVFKIRYRDAMKNVHYKIGHVTLLH